MTPIIGAPGAHDWRHKLEMRDRIDIQVLLEVALDDTTTSLVDAIRSATTAPVGSSFWLDIPPILARRAARYARILDAVTIGGRLQMTRETKLPQWALG